MLHPLEHVRDHQNPLANTPTLASCQAPQLGRPRFAAKEICRHRPSPKHGTLAHQLYHIWGSPEAGIIRIGVRSAEHRQGDLRYAVHPDHWGKGFATEALRRILEFGFEDLSL